jgi:hypothetical protein
MNKTAIKRLGVVQRGNVIALTEDLEIEPGTEVKIEIEVPRRRLRLDKSIFGMWKDRRDLSDSRKWANGLRDHRWRG